MSFFEKIISYIKNIFGKKEEVKQIDESKKNIIETDKKKEFEELLKVDIKKKEKKNKIETMVCDGDGLGIQDNITF